MTQNIAIVGSGFLGMTLARRLAKSGANVTLFESASQIGGLAAAWKIGDFTWDKHYHVTLASDSHTRKLVEELGLGDDFNWVETKTGFYTDGELVSMSDTMEFLKFPPLGLIGKLRLGATIFYASRVRNWKKLEKVTVEKWLTKHSGKKTFEKIWKPLLMAKLGEAYKDTSAAFIWATIQRMYAARNSGLKKEMFGYVRGGYARVLERFGEVLLENGVEIRLNSRIDLIDKLENGKIHVATAKARRHRDVKPSIMPQKTKYAKFQAAAEVDARPVSLPRNIQSNIRLASTCVPHCPLVIVSTMSNTFSTVMVIVVHTTRIVPQICGTLILRKICNGDAPSRMAASIVSSGMPRSAADRITIANPV